MEARSREEFDADRIENYVTITDYKTELNQFEIFCGTCGEMFFADKDQAAKCARAAEQGLDNPFLCDDCQREYEELAYAGR